MPAPKEYQGHRSWNAWAVALWISNDYDTYQTAVRTVKNCQGNLDRAARHMRHHHLPERAPDGAVYTQLAVKLALEGLEVTP